MKQRLRKGEKRRMGLAGGPNAVYISKPPKRKWIGHHTKEK